MRRALALATSLAVASCGAERSDEYAVRHESPVERGAELFHGPGASPSSLDAFSCSTCHREHDDPADFRLLPGAPLAGATSRPSFWGGQENDLLRAIDDCRFYFMSAQAPWTPDEPDAQAMWAWLGTLSGGAASAAALTVVPVATDLAQGDPTQGEDVYHRACFQCHGTEHTGQGRLASRISVLPEDVLSGHVGFKGSAIRGIFVEKIRHGAFLGYPGNMPPFSKQTLTDPQIAGLLAYLDLYSIPD